MQQNAPDLQKSAINPHFRNKYVPLEQLIPEVLPVLNAAGLVLLQFPTTIEGGEPGLRTRIIHASTGEFFEDTMPLMLAKDDPQGQGSAITYARRYSILSIFGLVADVDDDAEATRGKTTTKTARKLASVPSTDADGAGW